MAVTIRTVSQAAAAVRGRRRSLGMTQADLASRAGVSRKWVYEFEAGNGGAEVGNLLAVLEALGSVMEIRDDERPAAGALDLLALVDGLVNRD